MSFILGLICVNLRPSFTKKDFNLNFYIKVNTKNQQIKFNFINMLFR
jgi:hypothetical protein